MTELCCIVLNTIRMYVARTRRERKKMGGEKELQKIM